MQKTLLYKSISNDIIKDINNGKLAPGDKIPSVKNLCSSYDVSHVTALRVFRELSDSNLIMQKDGRQGYFVNSKSSAGHPVHTGTIGCIMRPLREIRTTDNYFNEIIYGIQNEVYNKRYDLLSSHFSSMFNKFHLTESVRSEILKAITDMSSKVDGFLIDELVPDEIINEAMKINKKPMVIVNRTSSLPVDTVAPADKDGICDLFNAAQRMGYDKFIYCTSGYGKESDIARVNAFKEIIKQQKISANSWNIIEGISKSPLKKTITRLIEVYNRLRGSGKILIMTPSDEISRVCCDALLDKKINIPSDLGITGFYGTGFAHYRKPELATIEISPETIGSQAVEVLVERILSRNYTIPKNHAVKGSLSLGESI